MVESLCDNSIYIALEKIDDYSEGFFLEKACCKDLNEVLKCWVINVDGCEDSGGGAQGRVCVIFRERAPPSRLK